MVKINLQGSEGMIKGFAFNLFNRKWMVVLSETKWHSGGRFKRTPIWASKIKGDKGKGEIPTLFIGKLAIGYLRTAGD